MSGSRYLADTNAFIYLLQKHPVIKPLLEADWAYCFITEIELLGKPGIKESEIKLVRNVLKAATKAIHVQEINDLAISLKQQYKIKTPDALIASTSLFTGLPLLTADTSFMKIKSLNILLIEF